MEESQDSSLEELIQSLMVYQMHKLTMCLWKLDSSMKESLTQRQTPVTILSSSRLWFSS
jgi:hypothetical protein